MEKQGSLDIYEEKYGDYGEAEGRRGGGGKRPHKGPTKSSETASKDEIERLNKERQLEAENRIKEYIDETWKSFDEAERPDRISKYAKWMERASRQKMLELSASEIRTKTKKSSGNGGQNIQKNETAVDLTHIPTRFTSGSQDERSKFQNADLALIKLTDKIQLHINTWKMTSKEFRQSLINSKQETQPSTPFEILPTGVSIGEMRNQMPQTSEMIIKFNWDGDTDNKPKIAYVGDNEKYAIYPNVEYRVNINSSNDGQVYMNPVDTKGNAPEISDIPGKLDRYLTSKKGKEDSGINISIKKNEANVSEVIKRVQDINSISEAYNKLKKFTTEYAANSLEKTLEDIEDILDLSKLDKGPRAYQVIFRQAWLIMESKYLSMTHSGEAPEDLTSLAEDSLLSFMQEIKKLVDTKPYELKSLISSDDEIAMHVAEVPIDPNEPEMKLMVLTTYIPDRGWSIMVPIGDCPNLAANMLDKFGQGKLDQSDNQVFYDSAKKAVDDGSLKFIGDGKTILFNKLSTLDPYMAVFHGGNNTLKQALETLRVAGDPVLGERTFKFIIYKDSSDLVVQQMPPITLSFD